MPVAQEAASYKEEEVESKEVTAEASGMELSEKHWQAAREATAKARQQVRI